MTISFHDVELLSAYLDGQLNPAETARLEARLASDRELKAMLDDLSPTRNLLRQLPVRRAPRNFTLTPQMAGIKPPAPRVYPALRFATVLASLLFVLSIAVNSLVPFAASHLAPSRLEAAPAYGIGGGGGGGLAVTQEAQAAAAAPAATEAPALAAPPSANSKAAPTEAPLSMPALATTNPTLSAEDHSRLPGTATPESLPAAPVIPPAPRQPVETANPPLIPLGWVIALGILIALCGSGAWLVKIQGERDFRRKFTNHPKDR